MWVLIPNLLFPIPQHPHPAKEESKAQSRPRSHSSEVPLWRSESNPGLPSKALYPGELPGGPVAKTLRSQCRGPGFDPWTIPHVTTENIACGN